MLIVPPSGSSEQFLSQTYVPEAGGAVRLRDPIGGELLSPGVVPDVLRHWPILEGGFDFLEREGHRIDFTVLLARHERGSDLGDAGIDLRAEAQQVQEKGGIFFLEVAGDDSTVNAAVRNLNDASQGGSYEDFARSIRTGGKSGPFVADVLDLIHNTGVRIDIADLRENDRGVLSIVYNTISKWIGVWAELDEAPYSDETADQVLIATAGSQNYREWMKVGLIGAALSRFQDRPPIDAPIVGTLFMGAAHRDIASKIAVVMGRPVRVEGISAEEASQAAVIVARAIGAAAISLHDAEAFRPLHKLNKIAGQGSFH